MPPETDVPPKPDTTITAKGAGIGKHKRRKTNDKAGSRQTLPTKSQRLAQRRKKRELNHNLCWFLWCEQEIHENFLCVAHYNEWDGHNKDNDAVAVRQFMRQGELGPNFYAYFRPDVTKKRE